jgi:hypothetical protein
MLIQFLYDLLVQLPGSAWVKPTTPNPNPPTPHPNQTNQNATEKKIIKIFQKNISKIKLQQKSKKSF